MILTLEQLVRIMPQVGENAPLYVAALNTAMQRFAINTPKRIAHFLGQLAHESGQLAHTRENLNYSAEALLRTWPTRFTDLRHARGFAHMPEAIANFVYANRFGNRGMSSGDGWRHRGAGWIQLTFKDNQMACGSYFGVSSDIGYWLSCPQGAALSAAWYWDSRKCNAIADEGDVDHMSDVINLGRHTERIGDAIGYADRLAFTNTALQVLA